MTKIAVRIDATDIPAKSILIAVRWLTDPLRTIILGNRDQVVRLVVINSVKTKWNVVSYDRLSTILHKNELIGGRAYASMLYDGIKASIFVETYDTIRNNITVMPFTEDYYKEKPKDAYLNINDVEFDNELNYTSSNIKDIISEFESSEPKMNQYSRQHGAVEEHVKKIIEQTITPRLTTTFLESADLHADISGMKQGMVTKDYLDTQIAKILAALGKNP